jgi:hypothetical protein
MVGDDVSSTNRCPPLTSYQFSPNRPARLGPGFAFSHLDDTEDFGKNFDKADPMSIADIDTLVMRLKKVVWLCDVVLNAGVSLEVYSAYFKNLSQFHTTRWVFQEIRSCALAILSDGIYCNQQITIASVSASCPDMTSQAAVQWNPISQLWDRLLLSARWFSNSMDLEDFHVRRVDLPEFVVWNLPGSSPALVLFHEFSHLVSALNWTDMLRIANAPVLDMMFAGASSKLFGIQDICMEDVMDPKFAPDRAIMTLAREQLAQVGRMSKSIPSYARMAAFLASLKDGHLASVLNADSFTLLAGHEAMLYIERQLKPEQDTEFLAAEAELFKLVEENLHTARCFCEVRKTYARSAGQRFLRQLSPKSRKVYRHRRTLAATLIERIPQVRANVYSLSGYNPTQSIPVDLNTHFIAPMKGWLRQPASRVPLHWTSCSSYCVSQKPSRAEDGAGLSDEIASSANQSNAAVTTAPADKEADHSIPLSKARS